MGQKTANKILQVIARYAQNLKIDVSVRKMKKRIIIFSVIIIPLMFLCAALFLNPFSRLCVLSDRHYSCQRCGAGIRKRGPLIVGCRQHYLTGIGGDKGLYCKKHGHLLVAEYNHDTEITDWIFHRDSYESEDTYLGELAHKEEHISRLNR
ncbi:hypothetical protein BVX94_03610 [bacterium B17]|nr:hypothetical protein BVX94_03610 [bacterium B17]